MATRYFRGRPGPLLPTSALWYYTGVNAWMSIFLPLVRSPPFLDLSFSPGVHTWPFERWLCMREVRIRPLLLRLMGFAAVAAKHRLPRAVSGLVSARTLTTSFRLVARGLSMPPMVSVEALLVLCLG